MENWDDYYSNLESSNTSILKNVQRLKTLSFFKNSNSSALILDLFSGCCHTAQGLKKYDYNRVVNGDFSFDLLTKNAVDRQVQLTAVQLPFKNSCFESIIVQGGLHHLESIEQIIQCMNDIKRVLKQGGRVFISEPGNTLALSTWLFFIRKTSLWKLTPYSRNWHDMYMAEEETHAHYLTITDSLLEYIKNNWLVEYHKKGLITEFFRIRKK
jgi:SAM-dependent methyltransferase